MEQLESANSSAGRNTLHGRRSRRWLLRGRTFDRIGHQADIDATVFGSAIPGLVRIYRLVLAQSHQVDLVGGNAVLRSQILNYGIGAALAQAIVVIGVADR